MAAQTEAECLLESGALYAKRLALRPSSGAPIFAGFKAGAFSLYYGDAPIYHFDLEGRWQRAYVGTLHYLKALDGSVQTIDRVREGGHLVLKRRTLSYAEASDFDAGVRARALDLLDDLAAGRLESVAPPPRAEPIATEELRSMLERTAEWDAAAWFAHRERYLDTYGPLPFLPPDCPSPAILQATLGHAGCRAFGLGAAHDHYVRSPREFAHHARAVARLLGRRVEQCKAVFLAGADALRRPEAEVSALLSTVADVFALDRQGLGVHTFLDDASPVGHDRATWTRFAALGLRRVTIGVESGAPDVRALYATSWRDEDLKRLVADVKAAGLGVGLLVLVGAGGASHAERHVADTTALLGALELGAGDLVSLVDARELAAQCLPFEPLSPDEAARQSEALRSGLAPLRSSRGAKVVPYRFEKQGENRS